jgi:flagellum-specific peptidoglycan hydrolase FlgJ
VRSSKAGNFTSIDQAFDAHGKLLGTAKIYSGARAKLPDPDAFADELTGVYATAHDYGVVLRSVMRSQGLYQYNLSARA